MPLPEKLGLMRDPGRRAELVAAAEGLPTIPMDELYVLPEGDARYDLGPDDTLGAHAKRREVSPAEAFLQLVEERNGNVLVNWPFLNDDLDAVETMLRDPHTVMGLADAGAHVGMIMDSSQPTFFLTYWIRDRGLSGIGEAIRRLTSDTAELFGVTDRGVLRPGAFADVNIIDLDGMRLPQPEYVNDFPRGAGRYVQRATGYDATIVNGAVFMEHGEHTGELAGTPPPFVTAPLAWFHGRMTTLEIPQALHRGEEELPFVALGDGTHLQLLQVDVEAGLWVIRTKFEPGVVVPTHKHTGEVFAFTRSGSWKYREYPEVNTAGSYLYEPAGSIHTLDGAGGEPRPHRRVVRDLRREPQPRCRGERRDGDRRRPRARHLLRPVRSRGPRPPTSHRHLTAPFSGFGVARLFARVTCPNSTAPTPKSRCARLVARSGKHRAWATGRPNGIGGPAGWSSRWSRRFCSLQQVSAPLLSPGSLPRSTWAAAPVRRRRVASGPSLPPVISRRLPVAR